MPRKRKPNTADFEWRLEENDDPNKGECYSIFGLFFNVSAAKRILVEKPRPLVMVDLSGIASWVKRPEEGVMNMGHVIDWSKVDAEEINVEFPLIVATLKEGPWLIDGWHRLAKGTENGQTVFPVGLLNKKETKSIRL